jgi:N-methylhydantoinase A/oxoprolinase/acetone carboxylase beta subunit
MIGTTHFTNAVVQRRDLTPVAAVRIGLPASASLEPFIDWPADLAAIVRGGVFMVEGGHEVDGRPIVPFHEAAMRQAAREIRASGVRSAAVTAIFSPIDAGDEERAGAILAEECPGVAVALAESGLDAPLYLTQNDGTVTLASQAEAFPVYSFASGPTNSMRGAAFLSRLDDAVVVDVGGTTTDVGCLRHGFPREANAVVEVGGVRTLFRMPDLLSLGLGGGTLVEPAPLTIGPRSVGYRLTEEALVFGGTTLTCTDLAVAAGLIELGDPTRVAHVSRALVSDGIRLIHERIAEAVDRTKTDAGDVPVIAVGGGSFLVPPRMPGVSQVVRVAHHPVANAVGAAIAQISGELDQVFQNMTREAALAEARRLAEERAVRSGARRESLKVVEVEDIPLAYLPGNSLRTRVRVVGDIAAPR